MPNQTARLSDIRLSDLPLDLLCLPLMLILLSWLSLSWALLVQTILLVVLLAAYARSGRLYRAKRSLVSFVLQLGLFYGLGRLGEALVAPRQYLILWHQTLWTLSFLVMHLLVLWLIRRAKLPRPKTQCCGCARLREEAINAEYIRFDRWLITFCLWTVGLALPAVFVLPHSTPIEYLLCHALSLASALIILFELYHLAWLRRRLNEERWVSILNEQGRAVGRVARSEIASAQGVLPAVRLVALSREMIYLERGLTLLDCLGDRQTTDAKRVYYDSPFCDWLSQDESPEAMAQRMIDARFCGIRRVRPRRLLPYRYQADSQRHLLVHLMLVEIPAPDLLYIDCSPLEGKWWSFGEVEALVGRPDCSPYLRNEWAIIASALKARGRQQNA